jgi:hypothetical protein
VSDRPSIGYWDLPSARDMDTMKREWDLDPGWVTSTLSGLSFGLSEIDSAHSAGGAPLGTGALAGVAGGIGGFVALFTASNVQDQVSGGISVLEHVTGLGSKLAALGSRAPVSVLAARLGAASTLLGFSSVWWEATVGGATAIQAGVEKQEREGKQAGFLRGFAASLIGMDQQSVASQLVRGPGSGSGLPSQNRAEQAGIDAFNASLWEGYEAGQPLTDETAIAIVSEADRYATERNVYLSPNRDPEVALVEALATVLPMLRREMRAGTWEASSEQLQAADAQVLDEESYPTSEAEPPEEQAPTLDEAPYPTSVPESIAEQELSAPATSDEAPEESEASARGEAELPGASTAPTDDMSQAIATDDAEAASSDRPADREDGTFNMEAEAHRSEGELQNASTVPAYDMRQDIANYEDAGAPAPVTAPPEDGSAVEDAGQMAYLDDETGQSDDQMAYLDDETGQSDDQMCYLDDGEEAGDASTSEPPEQARAQEDDGSADSDGGEAVIVDRPH